jgi:hypothetical protein
MSFTFRQAVRENVPLLIGIAGGTGSGKTLSALKLARGLAGDKPFALIDTENGRAQHYADLFQPWHHGDLAPPFRPERYSEAIKAADDAGYPVIVVDSASHEYAGEGGLLDWHEEDLDKRAGDDWKKREAMTFAAWVKPKMAHKSYVSRLLQVRAHVILCLRAEEKIEITKQGGKTVVRPKVTRTGLDGWVPICEKNLPYELTISVLLTGDEPGVPKPIKLQAQHRPFLPLDQPITEGTGVQLAAWAAGGDVSAEPTPEEAGLTDALLNLAEKLGKQDATAEKVEQHRRQHPGTHAHWLQTQIGHAEKAVAEAEDDQPALDFQASA